MRMSGFSTFKSFKSRGLHILFLASIFVLSLTMLAHAQEKPKLKIGYINGWADSVAVTFVAAQVLTERLGYPVELVSVEPALMWQGVARGDLDISLSAWMPTTHGEYHARLGRRVEMLGTSYPGARIGLVVPDEVPIRSIEELNQHAALFNNQIIGIDAGAGLMRRSEDAIAQYGLTLNLVPSSGTGMATALARAQREQKPIVVTGWVPHWKFAQWNLRFLDDPKGVYGQAEHIDTFAHPSLAEKAPQARAFLQRLSWGAEDVGAVMLAINEGATPEQAAKDWIAANPEKVESWLQK